MEEVIDRDQVVLLADLLRISGRVSTAYKRQAFLEEIGFDPGELELDAGAARDFSLVLVGGLNRTRNVQMLERLVDAIASDLPSRQSDLLRIRQTLALWERQNRSRQSGLDVPSAESPKASQDDEGRALARPYAAGNRWAVLVGINRYEDAFYPSLRVCVKDVEAIYQQLIISGFHPGCTRLLTDDTDLLPSRAKILSSLEQAARAAQRDDLVLFYYSGHGDVAGGRSYLVAHDGESQALKHTAVALSDVAEIPKRSQARSGVVVIDACHSGANFEGKGPRAMPPGFIERVFKQSRGHVILASCEQGELSYEWKAQERSVFTHFLLEALQGQADYDGKGFVTVQDANRYVSDGVRRWAFEHNRNQTPTLQGAMAGDIILTLYSSQRTDRL